MKSLVGQQWSIVVAPNVRSWWIRYSQTLLKVAVVLMTLIALVWLGYEMWRLVLQTGVMGAVDLGLRHEEVHAWFARQPVYKLLPTAGYPPASYVMLWPFLGWLDFTPARWLWAVTTLLALAWFAVIIVRESQAETTLERIFVALMLFAIYPTGATIGNGQLNIHLLPALVAGLLLLSRRRARWVDDLPVAFLLLLSLVKPPVSAPFFLIALFLPGGWRPVLFASIGYLALTLFAASFQPTDLVTLVREWLVLAQRAAVGSDGYSRYANIHIWLDNLGLEAWNLPVSLLILFGFAGWVYRYRRADPWLLIGVAAIVSRFWSYHRWYDDLLILLPMITLFRMAKQGPSADQTDVIAGVLLAITLLCMLVPGGVFLFPSPLNVLYTGVLTLVWIVALIFLMSRANSSAWQPTPALSKQ